MKQMKIVNEYHGRYTKLVVMWRFSYLSNSNVPSSLIERIMTKYEVFVKTNIYYTTMFEEKRKVKEGLDSVFVLLGNYKD
jgi:hypothetical protein